MTIQLLEDLKTANDEMLSRGESKDDVKTTIMNINY